MPHPSDTSRLTIYSSLPAHRLCRRLGLQTPCTKHFPCCSHVPRLSHVTLVRVPSVKSPRWIPRRARQRLALALRVPLAAAIRERGWQGGKERRRMKVGRERRRMPFLIRVLCLLMTRGRTRRHVAAVYLSRHLSSQKAAERERFRRRNFAPTRARSGTPKVGQEILRHGKGGKRRRRWWRRRWFVW